MAADGRLVKFSCTISDRPGGMAELTNLLYKVGVTIKDIQQERAWIKNDIFSVEDIVVVETIDADHAARMISELKKHFDNLSVTGLNLDGGDEFDEEVNGQNGHSLSPKRHHSGNRRGSNVRIETSTYD